MLTASPSPGLTSSPRCTRASPDSPRLRYDSLRKSSHNNSPISRPDPSHVYAAPKSTQPESQCQPRKNSGSSDLTTSIPPHTTRRNMVDAGTQYSPPPGYVSPAAARKAPAAQVARLNLADPSEPSAPPSVDAPAEPNLVPADSGSQPQSVQNQLSQGKRHASQSAQQPQTATPGTHQSQILETNQEINESPVSAKRQRPEDPMAKMMPIKYENCDPRDLVTLVSSMLMELIRYNDAIPLRDGALTRFHSRAPPTISVIDYLQRLTTHATLPPPILLSMVYYIDKLCALYPAFTISSLTVHRFLITAATVASKGLSDSFWTNKTYARVGGVSVKELALLELEFLVRVQWRIVPKPEVLEEYYRSLVERSPGYEIEHGEMEQVEASSQPA